jgi:hypothetical protein
MPENFIVTKRGVSLFTIEAAITSLILAVWLCRKYHWAKPKEVLAVIQDAIQTISK